MSYQVCEPLYSRNRHPKTKITIDQGGTSSAKTYTILQVLADIAVLEKSKVITVVGQDIPNLKKGALRDFQSIVASSPYLQSQIVNYHASDRTYYFRSGSLIEFNSYADEQDAKSGKRDYLFINEANGVPYMVYWQLAFRTRRHVWIDYNPTAKFWAHEKLLGEYNVSLIISDHRHNRFLSPEQHEEIESINDKELWKVYARGLTGKIHGLIYGNYQLVDSIPLHLNTVCGLDFGFNHKMALIECAKEGNRIFWNELIYQSELTIGELIQLMKMLNLGRKPIYCDHAAPDKIHDLKLAGFNALPADKDVLNGIDFVKRNNLYVTKGSAGIRKEVVSYKWKEDKQGVTLDEPVKFNDDACFTAETPVITDKGNKPIADIECGDRVLTSQGFKPVLHKFNNGCKEICEYKIVTLYGTIQLKCTPSHLVKTNSGWKYISELQAGETVYLASISMAGLTGDIKTEGISPVTNTPCTEMYGNSSMEQYPKDLRSITKMKIPITTTQPTCKSYLSRNTNNTIATKECPLTLHGLNRFRNKVLKQQRNGTKAKRAGNGINSMRNNTHPLCMKGRSKRNVSNAIASLPPLSLRKKIIYSVAANAKASGAGMQELIMSKSTASNAANHLLLTSITKQGFAQAVVVRSITGTPSGKAQVFDLCVSEVHEYYANGLLVHNCDAGRYGTYTHFHGGTTPIVVSNGMSQQAAPKISNADLLNSLG